MDNYDLYKVWYVIMKALEYGPLKNDIVHLDQVIENKVAHHHIESNAQSPILVAIHVLASACYPQLGRQTTAPLLPRAPSLVVGAWH